LPRVDSTAEFHTSNENEQVEYFFASDASAIIEHTNRVIFLEVKQLFSPPTSSGRKKLTRIFCYGSIG
jgi:hypothetical protein